MGISEKAIISPDEILEFIPQRAPIVMVDEFFGVDNELSVSGLLISEDNIFCEQSLPEKKTVLGECGIIEHIAQSAALRMGYIYKSNGKEVPLGFIGSINKLQVYSLPPAGKKLRTEIRIEQEVFNITLIYAVTKTDDFVIAECKMKIYLQEEV